MKNIPIALILSRLVIGFLILSLSYLQVEEYKILAIVLISIGLLSDIFDGIIARHLNTSTLFLRRLDSIVDQIFWLLIVAATFIQCPTFFLANKTLLIVILSLEALTYLVSFIKFRKEVVTHTIGAKMWVLFMFATLLEIIWSCDSTILFQLFFYVGILTRLEVVAILLVLKSWTNDVPGFYQAVLLRQGKPIKRNKLFNG